MPLYIVVRKEIPYDLIACLEPFLGCSPPRNFRKVQFSRLIKTRVKLQK